MAENRRGKDNRFYFSRGQMALLGGVFAFSAAIIFVLGIFVGKSIEESKAAKREAPLVKIPVSPAGQGAAGAATAPPQDEITFNDSVSKSEGSQVAFDGKADEQKLPEKVVKAELNDAKAQAKAESGAERTPMKHSSKSARNDETPKKAESESAAEVKEQAKVWRVQVDAFPEDRSAKQLVERLKNKGYNAYVTEQQNREKLWYRVNVGKYSSREEADKVVETLKSKENYTKAFSASK
jgi:cell division septation protein DedD